MGGRQRTSLFLGIEKSSTSTEQRSEKKEKKKRK